MNTESDKHPADPRTAELRHVALMREQQYVAVLVRLQDERAGIERWLAFRHRHASPVNIQEAVDLGIEALERSFVKSTKFGLEVGEHGFPYEPMKQKLRFLALTALEQLTKPRRLFKAPVGDSQQKAAPQTSFVDGADPLDEDGRDIVDKLDDAMESGPDCSAITEADADAMVADAGAMKADGEEPSVKASSATQGSRRDDSVFHAVAQAELLKRLDSALQALKSGQPEIYRMLLICFDYEATGAPGGFFAYLGQQLSCKEATARQKWQRQIRNADWPEKQVFNSIFRQFAEMETEDSSEEAMYDNQET